MIIPKKLLALLLFALIWLPVPAPAQPLRVAVSANAQFVMEKLRVAFQAKTGIAIEAIVSSSGKLTTQIQQGAPYDVFLSADMTYPQTLYAQGLTTTTPLVYGYGNLVLWTLTDLPLKADGQVLLNPAVRHVALANPATAPYGVAAMAYLQRHKLTETAQPKIVYGESIAQVNQYLLSGAAEVGFTAKSIVLDPSLKGRGHWIDIPQADYTPIAQGVVVLKQSKQLPLAEQFVAFLRSPPARRIFQQFGYRSPKP